MGDIFILHTEVAVRISNLIPSKHFIFIENCVIFDQPHKDYNFGMDFPFQMCFNDGPASLIVSVERFSREFLVLFQFPVD